MSVTFTLNGAAVESVADETLLQTAKRLGVEIPHLCYKDGMRADGNCRACMVEIKGERVLAPSCCRAPASGMEVSSDSARAKSAQKMIVELLAADMPARVYKPDSELDHWRRRLGVAKPRFAARAQPASDLSHPAMAVNGKGETLLVWAEGTGWEKGGSLAWQILSDKGRPTTIRGRLDGSIPVWSFAAAYAEADDSFVIVH